MQVSLSVAQSSEGTGRELQPCLGTSEVSILCCPEMSRRLDFTARLGYSWVVFWAGGLIFDLDECACDLLLRKICLPLILLNYLKTSLCSLSHSKKEPLMPVTKLKETPGPKSVTGQVRMYIVHGYVAGYIPALIYLTALIISMCLSRGRSAGDFCGSRVVVGCVWG